MDNLIVSINCVIPMFLILCLGLLIRRSGVIPPEMFNHLSTISFRFLLPCLLFYNVYAADLSTAVQPGLLLFLLLWVLVWFGLNYALYTAVQPDPRTRGALIQNAFRTNIAVIGVSLAQSMMDHDGVAAVAMATSILVPTYNILAVITLETCRGGGIDGKKTVKGILTNPLILACALGFVCLGLQVKLPACVKRAIVNVGNAGSVTTLIALGASFQFSGLSKNRGKLIHCNLVRLVLAPMLALTAAVLLGFRGNALGTVLVCTAAPMASTSYPMALACGSDHELTAQIVVTTSLLCCLSLFLWIFALKQLGLL